MEKILKNLRNLIENSARKYNSEYHWEEAELNDDFKDAYLAYIQKKGGNIEYYKYTSVVTTSISLNVFIPNQWFVVATYGVSVYSELMKYRSYFISVSEKVGIKKDEYAKKLKGLADHDTKKQFMAVAREVIKKCNNGCTEDQLDSAVKYLWRFVNDYSWWSGKKTIDRNDFHQSVLLNMLNLVHNSSSYITDIITAYSTDYKLDNLIGSLESFTENLKTSDLLTVTVDYSEDDDEIDIEEEKPKKKHTVISIHTNKKKTIKI